jgi:mono/diheme cytochrome c family protein
MRRPAALALLAALAAAGCGGDDAPPREQAAATPTAAARAPEGRALFLREGCGSCHHLAAAGSNGQVGPDLDTALRGHTAKSLRNAILAPPPGSPMPEDFASRLDAAELDALVRYLLSTPR